MRKPLLTTAVVVPFLLLTTTGFKFNSGQKAAPAADCKAVHWGYEGEHAPEHWQNLCKGFAACGGEAQSPIDIAGAKASAESELVPIQFDYHSIPVHIVNNGHTVQFQAEKGNQITINDEQYQLLQFHFHALSEHTVEGEHYPLELHFVHKNAKGKFAVVGVFYEEGAENALFAEHLANFPEENGKHQHEDTVDLNRLLPENHSYYHYSGSFTSPPCSEIVSWYVMKDAVTATKEQIDTLSELLGQNNRPTMPLNEREISIYAAE